MHRFYSLNMSPFITGVFLWCYRRGGGGCYNILCWFWQFVPLFFRKRLEIGVRSLLWWRNGGRAADPGERDVETSETLVDPTDEFYCSYDSTWEDEPSQNRSIEMSSLPRSNRYKFRRFQNAAKDMQTYRHDYPNQPRNQHLSKPEARPNLMFYLGQHPCLPDGLHISDIHKEWHGDYNKLEYVHTYIQWLFPLQEPGVNSEASILTKQEITDFLNNSFAKKNLLKSYKLMLDFYGIELINEITGDVRKTENWMERFDNFNRHTHNSLRITRILKCLGTLGYRDYQAPLVKFFLVETLVNGQLPNIKESVLNYFVFAVLDKKKRRNLLKFAYENYEPKEEFVWCPKKIQMFWLQQMKIQNGREKSP
uniref:Opioid growth factor receptor n=1 Tax=Nothobranchius kadleci TaxID=1051664 RepID=A0A1A8C684_NOTKA